MLFLPERQNFLCSGPGQCGGGSVKEDEGGERKGEGARDGAEVGGRGRGPVGQGQGPDRSSRGATAPQPKVTRGDRPNPRVPFPSGQTTEGDRSRYPRHHGSPLGEGGRRRPSGRR